MAFFLIEVKNQQGFNPIINIKEATTVYRRKSQSRESSKVLYMLAQYSACRMRKDHKFILLFIQVLSCERKKIPEVLPLSHPTSRAQRLLRISCSTSHSFPRAQSTQAINQHFNSSTSNTQPCMIKAQHGTFLHFTHTTVSLFLIPL